MAGHVGSNEIDVQARAHETEADEAGIACEREQASPGVWRKDDVEGELEMRRTAGTADGPVTAAGRIKRGTRPLPS